MKRYTDEPRTAEQELLALDSIYRVLTADERIMLHRSQHRMEAEITDNIWKLLKWIDQSGWTTPFMKYPEYHKDLLHYEDRNGRLQPLEHYKTEHLDLTEQITKLKYEQSKNL